MFLPNLFSNRYNVLGLPNSSYFDTILVGLDLVQFMLVFKSYSTPRNCY